MSRIVVDASVTLAWVFRDETSEYANRILRGAVRDTILVPAHWILEVANGVLSAERRGRLSAIESANCLSLVQKLPITIDGKGAEMAISNTLLLARTYGLTTYDAAYLELCLREGVPLATLDSDLSKALGQSGGMPA